MKTLIKYFAAAAALLALAACDKFPGRTREITIQAGIGAMTKVSTTGDKATFDAKDQITVYAWTGSATEVPATRVVDGVVNTYDGVKWTPAAQMLWEDVSSPHYFLGIHPVRTVKDFTADPFTLDPDDYKASDLMIAVNATGLKASATPVALTFGHAMARLDVNLNFRNQWETTPTVSAVTATAKKTATVNYLAAAPVTATGEAAKVALSKKSDAAWSGLQVPQTGLRTLTITIDGKDYVFTHSADIPLAGGQYTTVNLNIGRDRIDLGSMTINNWVAGSTIDGGEAQDD